MYHAVMALREEQMHPPVRQGCGRDKWTLCEGDAPHCPFVLRGFLSSLSSLLERCVVTLMNACACVYVHAHVCKCMVTLPWSPARSQGGWGPGLRRGTAGFQKEGSQTHPSHSSPLSSSDNPGKHFRQAFQRRQSSPCPGTGSLCPE